MCLAQVARSVWRAGSGRPRVAILGGVHGNERTGVEVVHRLVNRLSQSGAANGVNGELTLVLGNPEAIAQSVRFIDTDLNRCFGSDGPAGVQSFEHQRAGELACFLKDLDVMVDLHATNKPSAPFARLPGALDARYFNRCEELFLSSLPQQCRTVLWDPEGLIANGTMSDEFALRHAPRSGGSYICYEAGLASDVGAVPSTEAAVSALLRRLGVIKGDVPEAEAQTGRAWSHYMITEVFTLDERGFKWMNGHGQSNFQEIPAGEVYGQRGSDGPELVAAEESFMVFPKVDALWSVGRPLGWLAKRLPPFTRSSE